MKNAVLKSVNFKFIFLLVSFFLFNNLIYSQNTNERKLTREEKKIAKEKDLLQIEMKALLEKGYSLEKIENTPVKELRKESDVKDIQEIYSECNQERNYLRQREKELVNEQNKLKNHIAELQKRNLKLELLINKLQEKLKEESNKNQ